MNAMNRRLGRLRGLLLTLALLLAPLLGLAPARQAHAASGGCVTDNGTVTCTFNYTGAAETWTVPAGVRRATFDLYGAGPDFFGYAGKGGRVRATLDDLCIFLRAQTGAESDLNVDRNTTYCTPSGTH
jgi:hypothetical protein